MFGFGKKIKYYDVRLTEEQLRMITDKMTRQERKEFNRVQKVARSDREWNMITLSELV